MARTIHRIASATVALAILAVLTGSAGGGYARGDTDLTFSSPAFPDGGPIPVQYACPDVGGGETAPSLAWSAPPNVGGLAIVMDDPDAVGPQRPFVHWIVFGMHPGPGSSAEGQAQPGYGMLQPNGNGDRGYRGPCPPKGTGMHHYRFTLYQVPSTLEIPEQGADAATIARASTASVQFTGTYGPL
jgi:phosphatidylethanolamine-binding protein (PEBP) family uncharacterized protein